MLKTQKFLLFHVLGLLRKEVLGQIYGFPNILDLSAVIGIYGGSIVFLLQLLSIDFLYLIV